MSKERKLLSVALDFLDPRRWLDPADQHILNILTRDIEELLAQPEQTEQDAKDKFQDLATYGVSFSKRGQRIDPRDVYISTEPEQEPVAWMYEWVNEIGEHVKSVVYNFYDDANLIPLYTAPPKREPLSFEDLNTMWCGNPIDFARRIESIHGIGDE